MSDEAGWMTLGNMRANDVTRIDLWCRCGHYATVDVDHLPDAVRLPAMRLRYRCSRCGARPYSSRPHWPGRRVAPTPAI